VRAAADDLVARRFLLPADVEEAVAAAMAAYESVFVPSGTLSPAS
jgi:hypothetical protein